VRGDWGALCAALGAVGLVVGEIGEDIAAVEADVVAPVMEFASELWDVSEVEVDVCLDDAGDWQADGPEQDDVEGRVVARVEQVEG